jgi:hypothetical protein
MHESDQPVLTFRSTVTDIRLESRVQGIASWQIALEETLFSADSPTGRLIAIAPSGARLEVPVLGIIEERGTIWHRTEKPIAAGVEIVGELPAPRCP